MRPAHGQAFPYSFMGFAAGFRRRIMRCRGAFAQFTRLACRSSERDTMTTPVMPGAKCAGSALFPLPLVKSGARTRLPPNGRAVRREMRRRAITELANTMILFLNFEEGGRCWGQPPPPASRPTPVQRAVQETLLEAAEAMLCLQVSSAAMRTLALGRGKIARGWEDLDAIQSVINQSVLFGSDYRVSRVVAEAPVAPQDAAEDVQVDRLKLPQEAATVQLEDYLVDEDIREGYMRPSTLRSPTASRSLDALVTVCGEQSFQSSSARSTNAVCLQPCGMHWVRMLGSSGCGRAGTRAAGCGFCVW